MIKVNPGIPSQLSIGYLDRPPLFAVVSKTALGSVRKVIDTISMNASAYPAARETYAAAGVDTEAALATLAATPVSIHCWQGDDVGGFERPGGTLEGGGIQVTGSHPGRARTNDELRRDLEFAFGLIPGRQRVNLHAIYGDFGGGAVERSAIGPELCGGWIEGAKARRAGLDFNPTFFSHPLAADGRSEERRVGKECRSRWSPDHHKQ